MILHRALNQAVKWEYVTRNVAALVDAPRVEKYQATALTEQQIISLFESVRGHRLEALYWLALLGMRKGELLALEWRSVDLASGTLKITEGKTANSRRTLPLSPSLVAVLQKHWEQQQGERKQKGVDWKEHGLVFPSAVGTPLSPRNLTTTYKRALKRAGIPQSVRFHDLRHTAATLLLKQNAPKVVQMLLGHAQSSTTMEVYAHVALEQKEEAVRSLEGLFQLLSG
jgi:integrase